MTGATTKTVTVVTANDTVDEADGETFTVKLSDPVNATLATDGTVATGTINDNDDPAVLSIADATAVIEGGSASFVVSMGASEKQVTVSYETEDGTAAEPGDYTSTSGALTFEAGATTKTVTVVTANDTVDEADGETFTVKLSDPVNATLATDGTVATGTINDNDDPAVLSIADATAVIEGGSASFVVSMGASEKQVTVSYETEDGTAAETGDYTSTSGALTFEAGATTKTVTVVTANDTVDEADGETFTVKLSNPVNATLATDGTLATGTINDNDDPSGAVDRRCHGSDRRRYGVVRGEHGGEREAGDGVVRDGGRHGRRAWGLHVDERDADVCGWGHDEDGDGGDGERHGGRG